MSLGFKLITTFYIIALVVTFVEFPNELTNPSGFILTWTAVSVAMKVLSIIGIYLKRWGKIILAWMIISPLASLAYLIKIFTTPPPSVALNTHVLVTLNSLPPPSLNFTLISTITTGVLLGLFALFYTSRHQRYFAK